MSHLYTVTFSDQSTLAVASESIGDALHKAWLIVYSETGRDKEVVKIERNQ